MNVYFHLVAPNGQLLAGMTGHARIRCRDAPVATVLATKCLRFIHTEFWW